MKDKIDRIMTPEVFKKVTGIHITVNHNGKMSGMQSMSTSCTCNEFCKVYAQDPTKICSHCYAEVQMRMYSNMEQCFKRNTEILTSRILSKNEMPLLNVCLFRFEAFGDLNNEIQVINYFNICKANKYTKFALWTKNPWLVKKAIEMGYSKPRNLQIILSSHYLNVPTEKNEFDFVDKIFTVYDKDYIKEHNININCGARSCLGCKKCYLKSNDIYINEKLK